MWQRCMSIVHVVYNMYNMHLCGQFKAYRSYDKIWTNLNYSGPFLKEHPLERTPL